jgi:hypothetical protein
MKWIYLFLLSAISAYGQTNYTVETNVAYAYYTFWTVEWGNLPQGTGYTAVCFNSDLNTNITTLTNVPFPSSSALVPVGIVQPGTNRVMARFVNKSGVGPWGQLSFTGAGYEISSPNPGQISCLYSRDLYGWNTNHYPNPFISSYSGGEFWRTNGSTRMVWFRDSLPSQYPVSTNYVTNSVTVNNLGNNGNI